MLKDIIYYRKNTMIECILYKRVTQFYPVHTHVNHIILSYVMDGIVHIVANGQDCCYHAGDHFYIMPDISHAVEPERDTPYSMISVCISVDKILSDLEREINDTRRLKQIIMNTPENVFLIEDMAKLIGISPYHMIRQFKAACGLTPHQFQIQCRVRKAQKLLEEGKSVIEAAYATGFCDQSHFDRCFRKMVRLTPNEYKQSIQQIV